MKPFVCLVFMKLLLEINLGEKGTKARGCYSMLNPHSSIQAEKPGVFFHINLASCSFKLINITWIDKKPYGPVWGPFLLSPSQ